MTRNRKPRRTMLGYLTPFLVLAAVPLVVVYVTNLIVDPFAENGLVVREGFNKFKQPGLRRLDDKRTRGMDYVKAQSLILGSSRVTVLSIDHPGWTAKPVLNFGVPGANVAMIQKYLKHAQGIRPLKRVVIGLDFFAFNAFKPWPFDTDEHTAIVHAQNLAPRVRSLTWLPVIDLGPLQRYFFRHYFSLKTFTLSLSTVAEQKAYARYYLKGSGQQKIFVGTVAAYYKGVFFTPGYTQTFPTGGSTLDQFREIIAFCIANDIDLRLYFAPSHALVQEAIVRTGLWQQYENWKRDVTRIVDDAFRQAGRTGPLPLWDFSGYSAITTADPQFAGNQPEPIKLYNDPSHFSATVGNAILDRVLLDKTPADPMFSGFGVRLSRRIEGHLKNVRRDRERYLIRRRTFLDGFFAEVRKHI